MQNEYRKLMQSLVANIFNENQSEIFLRDAIIQ
jgi:hypothetical protein